MLISFVFIYGIIGTLAPLAPEATAKEPLEPFKLSLNIPLLLSPEIVANFPKRHR